MTQRRQSLLLDAKFLEELGAFHGAWPDFDLPEDEPDNEGPEPLISTDMPFVEHVARLRDRKQYTDGEE